MGIRKLKPRKATGKSFLTKVKTAAFAKRLGIKKVRDAKAKSAIMSIKKLPDTKTHVERHRVISARSGNEYIVSKTKASGYTQCNCMGFIRWGGCRHTDNIFKGRK